MEPMVRRTGSPKAPSPGRRGPARPSGCGKRDSFSSVSPGTSSDSKRPPSHRCPPPGHSHLVRSRCRQRCKGHRSNLRYTRPAPPGPGAPGRTPPPLRPPPAAPRRAPPVPRRTVARSQGRTPPRPALPRSPRGYARTPRRGVFRRWTQGGESALERVDRWLFPFRFVDIPLRPGPAEHNIQKREAALVRHEFVAAVQHRSHHRFALVQVEPHTGPLACLSSIGKGHLRGCPHGRGVRCRDERFQTVPERCRIVECQAGPKGEMASPDPGRPREIGKRGLLRGFAARASGRLIVEPFEIPPGQIAKRSGGLPGERQNPELSPNNPFYRVTGVIERCRNGRRDPTCRTRATLCCGSPTRHAAFRNLPRRHVSWYQKNEPRTISQRAADGRKRPANMSQSWSPARAGDPSRSRGWDYRG